MASAVEELQSRFACADITRASTVLIDDDRQNIEVIWGLLARLLACLLVDAPWT